MVCTKCGSENESGKKFCNNCGHALLARCSKCNSDNPPHSAFCGECGNALKTQQVSDKKPVLEISTGPEIRFLEPAQEEAVPLGERKTVTALFADIKGSTDLEQDLDPEDARKIIDPALKIMIEAVQHYGGYVVQSTGDGIFALFGAPLAHEDHPQRAIYAALRLLEEMKRYSVQLREAGNLPLEARVGINTGEVVVRSITTGQKQAEYTPIGHVTNLASRLQALASTGSIAISSATFRLVEGYFAVKPLGSTKIKGLTNPVEVYEVTGLGALRTRLQRSQARGLSKFVGRGPQMEALSSASDRALNGGGQVVAAVAEAGTGKSRLFFEFKAKRQSDFMVLEAFSVSHGKASAFLPVLDLFQSYFGITSDDDKRKRREKVTGRILALDRNLEDTLPFVFNLLAIAEDQNQIAQMDASTKKKRTLEALKRLLLRESLNQPLMVIFEDLHWVDEETQSFLNLLVDSIASAKFLLLVNYRPEYSHSFGSKTYYTQLRLDPLGEESAEELLVALLGDSPEMSKLKRMIIQKTHGNPFFLEETVQVLLDDGVLIRNGRELQLTKQIEELKIPPTVEGILASRIDRLPEEDKDLLQTLAVIGKEFPLELVRRVTKVPRDELIRMLNELQLAEFIYEQPATGDVEYSFKHALTLLVSYNSILTDRRKNMHERIGAAIESLYADSLHDHLPELAHHYSRSKNSAKAITYLQASADQALDRGAFEEGITLLRRAVDLVQTMPQTPDRDRTELELREKLMTPLGFSSGFGSTEARTVFERVLELSKSLNDTPKLVNATARLASYYFSSGQINEGLETVGEALRAAEQLGDASELARAHAVAGLGKILNGEFGLAAIHLRACIEFAEKAQNKEIALTVYSAVTLIVIDLMILGRLGEGFETAYAVFTRDQGSSHPAMTCMAHFLLAGAFRNADYDKCLYHADIAIEMAKEIGLGQIEVQVEMVRIGGLVRLGRYKEALTLHKVVSARSSQLLSLSTSIASPAHLLCLAQGKMEGPEIGLSSLDKLLAEWEKAGFKVSLSEAHTCRGDLLMMLGEAKMAEAESEFRKAIEIAQQQGAKWYELKATIPLAKLLRDTNRREEAHSMLSAKYHAIAGGTDTAEMLKAKVLIDELGENR